MTRRLAGALCTLALVATLPCGLSAWGARGHAVVSRAAVQSLPLSVPLFLSKQIDWIGARSVLADTWRRPTEPFLKESEDPNHVWQMERFAFLRAVPRSRDEFLLAVYEEYQRIRQTEPQRAAYTNIHYTGTLPYAAVECYERLKVAFRQFREQRAAKQDTTFIEEDAAFYAGWLSHYVADGAQPMHTSIHYDGWTGDDPKGYTRQPGLHWKFENDFVDLIGLSERDVVARIPPNPARLADPFTAMLDHVTRSHGRVERIYMLDLQKAFDSGESRDGREFVYTQIADAATVLRDLINTAWITSADPAPAPGMTDPTNDPKSPEYNPATGSAPAPAPR
jgi:hypothetical protein